MTNWRLKRRQGRIEEKKETRHPGIGAGQTRTSLPGSSGALNFRRCPPSVRCISPSTARSELGTLSLSLSPKGRDRGQVDTVYLSQPTGLGKLTLPNLSPSNPPCLLIGAPARLASPAIRTAKPVDSASLATAAARADRLANRQAPPNNAQQGFRGSARHPPSLGYSVSSTEATRSRIRGLARHCACRVLSTCSARYGKNPPEHTSDRLHTLADLHASFPLAVMRGSTTSAHFSW
jgi:hypothetical protein